MASVDMGSSFSRLAGITVEVILVYYADNYCQLTLWYGMVWFGWNVSYGTKGLPRVVHQEVVTEELFQNRPCETQMPMFKNDKHYPYAGSDKLCTCHTRDLIESRCSLPQQHPATSRGGGRYGYHLPHLHQYTMITYLVYGLFYPMYICRSTIVSLTTFSFD